MDYILHHTYIFHTIPQRFRLRGLRASDCVIVVPKIDIENILAARYQNISFHSKVWSERVANNPVFCLAIIVFAWLRTPPNNDGGVINNEAVSPSSILANEDEDYDRKQKYLDVKELAENKSTQFYK